MSDNEPKSDLSQSLRHVSKVPTTKVHPAPHGGLTAAHEAVSPKRDRGGSHSGRRTPMITVALCLAATGMVAISLESLGVATSLWGIALLLIRYA
jgi:hypothetical protein